MTPTLGPDATGIGWVFQYALVDKTGKHGLDELRTFQDFTLRYALDSVPGVAEVASVGGYQKQYQVTVDPDRLRAYGVTLQEVIDAIRQSNNDVGGRIARDARAASTTSAAAATSQDLGAIEQIAVRAARAERHAAARERRRRRCASGPTSGAACSSGTARARRSAASWSCATARTRST